MVESISNPQIDSAIQRLTNGELVAIPTETVYGLGADAENITAINKIFSIKNRPSNHPLIVHLSENADINYWASNVGESVNKLIKAFWPGPLTLILQKAEHINGVVTGGQNTIGLRCPSHPVALQLLKEFANTKPNGCAGIAAPSANKFGHISPTDAQHVRSEFPDLTDEQLLILEGGPSQVGIESTILDVSHDGVAVLLRPGHITAQQIYDVLGVYPELPNAKSPRVSGSLKAHYAPKTHFSLASCDEITNYIENYIPDTDDKIAIVLLHANVIKPSPEVDLWRMPSNSADYAQIMYSVLRNLDNQNYQKIIFEMPPQLPQWQAINDRLSRAAAAF